MKPTETANLLETLPPAFADPFMRQWLCSCAAFPGLRFSLTMQLGRRLAEEMKRPDPPGENEAMTLFRLPWFREGRMPDDVRGALIDALEDCHFKLVRETLEEVMFHAVDKAPQLGAPEDFRKPAQGWRRRWAGFLFSRSPGSRQHDLIYRRIMLGDRPREHDRVIERWTRRIVGDSATIWIDRHTLPAMAMAVVATVVMVWVALSSPPIGEERVETSERPAEITFFRSCDQCPEMVLLPAGSFVMGSPEDEEGRFSDEGPRHTVTFAEPFAIGVNEVTFDQYDAFATATKREPPNDQGWGRGRRPVIHVSWNDAKAYAAWLGDTTGKECRLPSEAEWEYACRAGTETPYAFGNELTAEMANAGGSVGRTTEVGRYPANGFGLHDMHGNVWEWVEDHWHDSYDLAPGDGRAWLQEGAGESSLRVVRGGSWYDNRDFARCAYRIHGDPYDRGSNVGFRVVCSSPISTSDP